MRKGFQVLENKEMETDIEWKFKVIQIACPESAEVLGRPRKRKQWISEASWKLLDERGEFLTTRRDIQGKDILKYRDKDIEV